MSKYHPESSLISVADKAHKRYTSIDQASEDPNVSINQLKQRKAYDLIYSKELLTEH